MALESLSADTVYPNAVQRTQVLFSQAKHTGDSPQLVAEAIESAINSTELKLRFSVGGAEIFIDGRARMSDEEWIAMGRHETVEDYFKEFAARFSMPAN